MARKVRAALAAMAVALTMTAAACDDQEASPDKTDEDDGRIGPGDGNDEIGPGR